MWLCEKKTVRKKDKYRDILCTGAHSCCEAVVDDPPVGRTLHCLGQDLQTAKDDELKTKGKHSNVYKYINYPS